MSDLSQANVCIVGAGLAGTLMANFLARAGARVELYERRADPRQTGIAGGRSINLAISARGIDALQRIGLAESIMQHAIPMRGRMIHAPDGTCSFQPYDKDPARCIHSISRGGLNLALVTAAERYDHVAIHFDHKCIGVDLDRPAVQFVRTTDNATTPHTVTADLIIGADGAFSAVRASMQRRDRFDYSQTYLAHGYKELHIPPDSGGGFQLDPHALHIWPRAAFMMIALPNPDGSFTCTLFWPFDGPNSFAAVGGDDQVGRFFERHFPDAVPLMPTLVEDYGRNPTSSLVTVRCHPWHVGGRVALIGDAAHAIVPFYGQGMNAAFEDCVALDRFLREHSGDRSAALERYTRQRKVNADAIADLAVQNFLEMRDHAARRTFRIRKAAERALHRFWPGYTPLYSMVSFTTLPYAAAVGRARRQGRLVRIVLSLLAVLVIAALLWLVLV